MHTSSNQYDENLLCAEYINHPYATYSRLRQHAPVYWSEQIQAWIITRYDDVVSCLSDKRFSANRIIPRIKQFPDTLQAEFEPLLTILSMWPLMLDRPEHTRLRSLINQSITPSIVSSFIPIIQQQANILLDNALKNDTTDAIAELAYPYPLNVVSEIIGLRKEDRPRLKAFAVDIVNFFGCAPEMYIERARIAMKSVADTSEIIRETIAKRRVKPASDLISSFIRAEQCGEIMSEDEIVATCLMMVFAGFETTTNLIGNGLLLLLQHPQEMQKLRANPGLMDSAIREMLRFESPVQRLSRMATEDLELHGCKIKRGDLVFLIAASANRDQDQFSHPDNFDITRNDRNHLAFGHSIHLCPGNNLAQLEARILFAELLKRKDKISLINPHAEWQENLSVRSLVALPLSFT